jgi:hypothetical protein
MTFEIPAATEAKENFHIAKTFGAKIASVHS